MTRQRLGVVTLGACHARVGEEVLDWLRQAALPAVVVGGDTVTAALDCVYADNLDAGLQATRHVLSLGHRRLAGRTRSWCAGGREFFGT